MLVFRAHNAAFAVVCLNREVLQRYPSPDELIIASVVDPSLVPPFFQPSARMALEMAYRQAAASLPREAGPADYVVLVAHWTGRVTRDYGASGAYRVPVAGFIVGDGRMLGRRPPPDDAGAAARGLRESALHNRNAGRTLKPPSGP